MDVPLDIPTIDIPTIFNFYDRDSMSAHFLQQPAPLHRFMGSMLGFAIGDALGAPRAGVHILDLDIIRREEGFCANPDHPILGWMSAGMVTANTIVMIDVLRDIVHANGCYDVGVRKRSLVRWASHSLQSSTGSRWPGSTTLRGASGLARGGCAAPIETDSIGSLYRTLPIVGFVSSLSDLEMITGREAGLTHVGTEVRASTIIYNLIYYFVLRGATVARASASAEEILKEIPQIRCSQTYARIFDRSLATLDLEELQQRFGNGARCHQSVPLAVHTAKRHEGDFHTGVHRASYFVRTEPTDVSLLTSTKVEQIQGTNGGNTDGLAGLVGCLLGCQLSAEEIFGGKWRSLECMQEIIALLTDYHYAARFRSSACGRYTGRSSRI